MPVCRNRVKWRTPAKGPRLCLPVCPPYMSAKSPHLSTSLRSRLFYSGEILPCPLLGPRHIFVSKREFNLREVDRAAGPGRGKKMSQAVTSFSDVIDAGKMDTCVRFWRRGSSAAEAMVRAAWKAGGLLREVERSGGGDRRSDEFQTSQHQTFETAYQAMLESAGGLLREVEREPRKRTDTRSQAVTQYQSIIDTANLDRMTAHRWQVICWKMPTRWWSAACFKSSRSSPFLNSSTLEAQALQCPAATWSRPRQI